MASTPGSATRRTWPSRAQQVLLALSLLCAPGAPATGSEDVGQTAPEYQVKAAFLVNFIKFVEWPGEADGDITIAILGSTHADVLEQALKGKMVQNRHLVVRQSGGLKDLQPCHVLFVLADEDTHLADAVKALAGAPVLTISESDRGEVTDAVINLVSVDTRLAFAVNLDAADASRLQVSSKLLNLARAVRGRRMVRK